jgi:hypothetical protein
MIETLAERRNGVGPAMPIKAIDVDCTDAGYPGWHAKLRTNIPARVYDDFISQNEEKFWSSLAQIVVEWNFADENGEPLPTPADGLSWRDLPYDLAQFLVRRYLEAFAAAVQIPKAPEPSSEPTSRTDDVPRSAD